MGDLRAFEKNVDAKVADSTGIMSYLRAADRAEVSGLTMGILVKGARCAPGLHLPVMRDTADPLYGQEYKACECGCPDCLGWVAMRVKTAPAP